MRAASTIHRVLFVVLVAAIACAAHGVAVAQIDFGRLPSRGPEPPSLPVPLPELSVKGPGSQLVGYTNATMHGGVGVLNMTRAYQAEFPTLVDVRICTASEILETVNVPPAPGWGFGWVNSGAVAPMNVRRLPFDKSRTVEDGDLSCRGWMSSFELDSGLTIDLGHEECYGAFAAVPCNVRLNVACCGKAPV